MARKKGNASFDLLAADIDQVKEGNEEFSDIDNDTVSDATIELEMVKKEEPVTLEELESDFEKEEVTEEVEDKNEVPDINETIESEEVTNSSKDINQMFEKATTGVLEAKNIFARNVEMKEQIDKKFEELENARKEFENGIVFADGTKCMPAKLETVPDSDNKKGIVTICEGKYHQVKKMFLCCGTNVVHLQRISIGNLFL